MVTAGRKYDCNRVNIPAIALAHIEDNRIEGAGRTGLQYGPVSRRQNL